MLQKLELTIRRGETVNLPIRVESDTLVYKAITAIAQSAPVSVTATAHGLTTGWRACVENALGMTDINAENHPPKDKDLRRVTVVDANTVEFNAVNAAGFKAYKSGGQLVYYAPMDLSLYVSAKMEVKDKVGGTVLATLTTAGVTPTLEIDAVNNAVWVKLTDEVTAAYAFDTGVFDIELIDGAGGVTPLCSAESTFSIQPEITTS